MTRRWFILGGASQTWAVPDMRYCYQKPSNTPKEISEGKGIKHFFFSRSDRLPNMITHSWINEFEVEANGTCFSANSPVNSSDDMIWAPGPFERLSTSSRRRKHPQHFLFLFPAYIWHTAAASGLVTQHHYKSNQVKNSTDYFKMVNFLAIHLGHRTPALLRLREASCSRG